MVIMRKLFSVIFLLLPSLFAIDARGEEYTMPAQSLSADVATTISAPFGINKDGEPVELFILTNRKGAVAKFTDYGATLTEWWVPDKEGKLVDIVLGFATLAQYEDDTAYLGAIIGRYANRISGGRFSLDGRDYALTLNHGRHTLHGG